MAEYIVSLPTEETPLKYQCFPVDKITGELVRCKDCKYRCGNTRCSLHDIYPEYDWFCADGRKKDASQNA